MSRPLLEIFDEVRHAANDKDVAQLKALSDELDKSSEETASGWKLLTDARIIRIEGLPEDAVVLLKRAKEFFEDSEDLNGKAYATREYARWARRIGVDVDRIAAMKEALALFERAENTAAWLITKGMLCVHYKREKQSDTALQIGEEVLAEARAFGEPYTLASTLTALTELFVEGKDHERSLQLALEAEEIASQHNDRFNTLEAIATQASVHYHRADFPEAMVACRRFLEIAGQYNLVEEQGYGLGLVGILYGHLGDHDRSLEFFQQSIEFMIRTGNRTLLSNAYGNVGALQYLMNLPEEAFESHTKALDLARQTNSQSMIDRALVNLAGTVISLGHLNDARQYLDAFSDHDDKSPTVRIEYWLFRGRIARLEGDLEESQRFVERAEDVANSTDEQTLRDILYAELRDLAMAKNDLAEYVKYNDLYTKATTEKMGRETTRRIAVMEREQEMARIEQERNQERAVLYSTLPKHVADRVIMGEQVTDHFDEASVLFLDIVGFTSISDRIPAGHVVHLLDAIFAVCDDVCQKHGLTKVKTIGDSYLAVAGIPEPLTDHAYRTAQAALDMMRGLAELQITMPPEMGDTSWVDDIGEVNVRIGLHCGPAVAGVVGRERLQYDVWGDTVNTASRMESTGEAGKIQCSDSFARALCLVPSALGESDQAPGTWHQALTERGEVSVKGKGTMKTYWLESS